MTIQRMFMGLFCLGLFPAAPIAAVQTDKPAPDFTLPAADGQSHSLSDFKGQYVVLEWVNFQCPFVRKFYDVGKMQELQKHFTDDGVVWLSICSSAPGKQGYLSASEAQAALNAEQAVPTAFLLDPEGDVGRLYAAKTTPHIYIIDPEGTLIYQGAIDSVRSTDSSDIEGATNYVVATLEAAMAGKAVQEKETRSYGCSVKY